MMSFFKERESPLTVVVASATTAVTPTWRLVPSNSLIKAGLLAKEAASAPLATVAPPMAVPLALYSYNANPAP